MHLPGAQDGHQLAWNADWCGPCILLADELKKVRPQLQLHASGYLSSASVGTVQGTPYCCTFRFRPMGSANIQALMTPQIHVRHGHATARLS